MDTKQYTDNEILSQLFFKPETQDWYMPVLAAMEMVRKQTAAQFHPVPDSSNNYEWQNEFYANVGYDYAEHIPEIKDSVELFQSYIDKGMFAASQPAGDGGTFDLNGGSGTPIKDVELFRWVGCNTDEQQCRESCNNKDDRTKCILAKFEKVLPVLSLVKDVEDGWVSVEKKKLEKLYLIASFDSYNKCDSDENKFLSEFESIVFPDGEMNVHLQGIAANGFGFCDAARIDLHQR